MTGVSLVLRIDFTDAQAMARWLTTEPPEGVTGVKILPTAQEPTAVTLPRPAEKPTQGRTQYRPYPRRNWTKGEEDKLLAHWATWPRNRSLTLLGAELSEELNRSPQNIAGRLRQLLHQAEAEGRQK